MLALPGAQIRLEQALELARRACAASASGDGVVITTGTDTLEEIAVLCALLHFGDAPIVLTGANRPSSSPGADGPANLLDAVVVAGSSASSGIGTVVVFGGEIHAATSVRKVDSTGPAAFGSPIAGALGRVAEGRVWLHARPLRPRTLDVAALGHRVEIVTAALGDDGALFRQAAAGADGVVVVALGAGHLGPAMIGELDGRGAAHPDRRHLPSRSARRCCSRPTASRAPSAICGRARRSARRSCRRLRRGWRCSAASGRGWAEAIAAELRPWDAQ